MVELDKKNFVLFTIAWFFISFLVLWFLGGACLSFFVSPSQVNSVCLSNNFLNNLRNIPLINLFLPYQNWVSLFYWFAPIAGFVFAFFGIKWWNEYFKTKEASSIIFLVIILFFLLFGHYITLNWYYGEVAALNSRDGLNVSLFVCFDNDFVSCNNTVNKLNEEYIAQAQRSGSNTFNQLIMLDYWAELRKNIFLTFILGAICAWIPLFLKDNFFKK